MDGTDRGAGTSSAARAALEVLDRHFAALNAQDAEALADTLHFPHYRLSRAGMRVWEGPETYLADFHARAGEDWHHTAWGFRTVVAEDPDKVHLDVQFSRYREDGSVLGTFRALWVVTRRDGRWAAELRSSFAD
jgi:hypothetical protein